ncbi:hypothetical protein E2P81_ATG09200 [Venturia nashicola]|uniref:Metallo-beta-lactamase domain-containing protein n=1 Tax=Venturia nashicola TaxID=86259 RepID=A0A4Z1NG50_9PEZI|nr:hypothetical protein E6O75_ATG09400 [Venturia nashicola]TLD20130.1 hypothetical protein E2P81_ATG09200 [Venturia nashicola]
MALTINALNNDTSFYLIFTPTIAPEKNIHPEQFPGAYTILIDPWISGPAQIIGKKFSHQEHPEPSCLTSLKELPEPDLILISQSQPDHCHEKTLCDLPPETASLILAPAGAVKKIKSWKHFDNDNIYCLKTYNPKKEHSVFRIQVPSFSPSGGPGEVTISLLEPKRDITGVHNAIGITYRPPYSVLSLKTISYFNVPTCDPIPPLPTTPLSPTPTPTISLPSTPLSARANTIFPNPLNHMEKTISVLYSPHGAPYSCIHPWATSHLISNSALPLLALIHSFTQVDMPWYMGGNMATGSPGGIEIARNLLPKIWIGAHDERKVVAGMLTRGIERTDFEPDEVKRGLEGVAGKLGRTDILTLRAGMEVRVTPGEKEISEPRESWIKTAIDTVEKENPDEKNTCEEADKEIKAKSKEKDQCAGRVKEIPLTESQDIIDPSLNPYNDIGS